MDMFTVIILLHRNCNETTQTMAKITQQQTTSLIALSGVFRVDSVGKDIVFVTYFIVIHLVGGPWNNGW